MSWARQEHHSLAHFPIQFVFTFTASILIGVACALFAALTFKHLRLREVCVGSHEYIWCNNLDTLLLLLLLLLFTMSSSSIHQDEPCLTNYRLFDQSSTASLEISPTLVGNLIYDNYDRNNNTKLTVVDHLQVF